MASSPNDFIDEVARARGLHVNATGRHAFRLEPRDESPGWYCDLDDGTPTGESDPASSVRWVCPPLRVVRPPTSAASPLLDVHRPGPHSDLGRLISRFRSLAGRSSGPSTSGVEPRYVYTDPHGFLDARLRHRVEHWPTAMHGDGIVRPAELWSIQITAEGLVVTSVSWWGSAPALEHQIALGVDIAGLLAAHQADGHPDQPPDSPKQTPS